MLLHSVSCRHIRETPREDRCSGHFQCSYDDLASLGGVDEFVEYFLDDFVAEYLADQDFESTLGNLADGSAVGELVAQYSADAYDSRFAGQIGCLLDLRHLLIHLRSLVSPVISNYESGHAIPYRL